jgi:hypothetical protein
MVDHQHHAQRKQSDKNLAEDADKNGPPALRDKVAQLRAKADPRECGKEGPFTQVAERAELACREEADARKDRESHEAEDELRKLLPEEKGFALDASGFALRCPVDR